MTMMESFVMVEKRVKVLCVKPRLYAHKHTLRPPNRINSNVPSFALMFHLPNFLLL